MPRRPREEREALMRQVVRMRQEGMTFQAIADTLGLGRRQEARLLFVASLRQTNPQQGESYDEEF